MNFPSRARLLLRQALLGLGSSTAVHGAAATSIVLTLLAWPSDWEFEIRRGESIVIQAQMSAVAATQVEVREVEVSIEPLPLEPPPPVAVDHAPIRDTLEPVPAAIPVVRVGEYEPNDIPPQDKSPESPAEAKVETKTPPKEVAQTDAPQEEQPKQLPDRQVAEIVRESLNKINTAAAAASVAGAQVDEMPRKLSNNREPSYPLAALQAGLEGKVILRVMIGSNGRPAKIAVETSSGYTSFDESAMVAVRDWEFIPAKRKGQAVMHEVLVPVRFRIRR